MSNETLEEAAIALYEQDGGHPEIWGNIGDELRQKYRDRAANPPDQSTRITKISIGKTSTLLAEQRFYDNTFLRGDDGGAILFILDAALVRGPSGRERLRVRRDVIDFPDLASLAAAIEVCGWEEAPLDADRDWRPAIAALRETETGPQ